MAPIAIGFGLGYPPLGAFLGGAIAGGVLMAVFLANSGGAWDNAKKLVEDGNYGGKGSDVHAATVVGDTVGDPFKDTAGPSINPLLKVMNLVSAADRPDGREVLGRGGREHRAAGQHRGSGGGGDRGGDRVLEASGLGARCHATGRRAATVTELRGERLTRPTPCTLHLDFLRPRSTALRAPRRAVDGLIPGCLGVDPQHLPGHARWYWRDGATGLSAVPCPGNGVAHDAGGARERTVLRRTDGVATT